MITTLVVRFKGHKSNDPIFTHGEFTLERDYDVNFIDLDGTYKLKDDRGKSVWENQDSFIVTYIRKDNESI